MRIGRDSIRKPSKSWLSARGGTRYGALFVVAIGFPSFVTTRITAFWLAA